MYREHLEEIIFENRNKHYGAYQLRRKHDLYLLIGFLIASALIGLLFGAPKIAEYFSAKGDDQIHIETRKTVKYSELSAPPPIEIERPPEPVKLPPKSRSIKYLPPVAKPDVEVPDEEIIPTQGELSEATPSTETVESTDTVIYDEEVSITVEEPEEEVQQPFTYAEEMPSFPGGDLELLKFLTKNLEYPRQAIELEVEGRVFVSFVINTDGSVSNAEVIRGIGSGCDEEALRVIKMMPKWNPGRQSGRHVPVRYVLPVSFEIQH